MTWTGQEIRQDLPGLERAGVSHGRQGLGKLGSFSDSNSLEFPVRAKTNKLSSPALAGLGSICSSSSQSYAENVPFTLELLSC